METENEILIGLEIHIELDNKSKLFCGCSTGGAIEPNTLTCPVCLGHPGSKPVLNKAVVDHALKLALALNCNISPELIFSRKIYFYPDMAKNFQITQYEIPLGSKGYLQLSNKKVGITRVHIEEDPASLVHPVGMQQSSYVLVDYNRSGHPLCEVVTEPQMYSAEEAREFMKRLLTTLKYLKIFDPDRCVIKADANVNIVGCERVEIKNITGFKEIEKAILYEVSRQEKLKKEGKLIKTRETRGWDSENGVTIFQRRKETEEDYGYIIEPDLAKIDITDDMVKKTKAALPELPDKKSLRYQKELKLKREDADAIANSYDLANLYESVIKYIDPIFAAEWIRREVVRVLNYNKKELNESFINKNLISVLGLIKNNKITRLTGQRLMELLVDKDINVEDYVKKEGLVAISDVGNLKKLCEEAINENKKAVEDYKKGREEALNFIVGQVMKKTKGKATPQELNKIIRDLIK